MGRPSPMITIMILSNRRGPDTPTWSIWVHPEARKVASRAKNNERQEEITAKAAATLKLVVWFATSGCGYPRPEATERTGRAPTVATIHAPISSARVGRRQLTGSGRRATKSISLLCVCIYYLRCASQLGCPWPLFQFAYLAANGRTSGPFLGPNGLSLAVVVVALVASLDVCPL